MFKKKDVDKLLIWARKAQYIFEKSGETDFNELKRREKIEMVSTLEELGISPEFDGDSSGMSESVCIKDGTAYISVVFFSRAECLENFNDELYSLQCCFNDVLYQSDYDDSDITFDEFVDLLDDLLKKDITIINLTPHAVTFYAKDGKTVINTIPSSGVARAAQTRKPITEINGIPVSKTEYGAVEGLPESQDNTIYIVSVLTAQAAPERTDLYIVDDMVRDVSGQILGCKALAQI